MASALSVEAETGIGLAAAVHEQRGHGDAGEPSRQAWQRVVQRREGRCIGVDGEAQIGKRRGGCRIGEVGRPEQPHRLHEVGLAATAGHRLSLEVLHTRDVARRRPAHQLGVELRFPAIADASERVDDQCCDDTLRMLGEQVQQQVAAPGVAGNDGALPAEAVEHRDDVRDLGAHVVGRAGGRGR